MLVKGTLVWNQAKTQQRENLAHYSWDVHNVCIWIIYYSDIIMGAMASQITSLTIVYSTVYSGADQRKHQSSASLVFARGIHRWLVNSPHKGQVTRKMFPFDDVMMCNSCIYHNVEALFSKLEVTLLCNMSGNRCILFITNWTYDNKFVCKITFPCMLFLNNTLCVLYDSESLNSNQTSSVSWHFINIFSTTLS